MKKYLLDIGLNEKEVVIYLLLLEFWTQPASIIAKKIWIPKSTVLFILNWLVKKWYVRKSNKWIIQYFFVVPDDLQQTKEFEIKKQLESLGKVIPLLKEFKNPFSSEPKVIFFEWIEWCKKAYLMLLDSKTEILEFGAHNDLENKFWKEFMNSFIKKRTKNKILLKWICKYDTVHKDLHKKDKNEFRKLKFFNKELWNLYSSICIYENKVLFLNLFTDSFWILIENKEVYETLKTIHKLVWNDYAN